MSLKRQLKREVMIIRMSDDFKKMVHKQAKLNLMTSSEYVRMCVLNQMNK